MIIDKEIKALESELPSITTQRKPINKMFEALDDMKISELHSDESLN